jgi:hypothetical protein
MTSRWKAVIVILAIAAAGSISALLWIHFHPPQTIKLTGAVIVSSADVDKQVPIGGVRVTVAGDLATGEGWSSPTGYFELSLRKQANAGQPVILQFRHPQYEPLDVPVLAADRLYVVRMVPIVQPSRTDSKLAHVVVSNVTIRYSVKTTISVNVGSAVKTFRVVNTANIPCNGQTPCSPDRKWKAAVGSATLEAPGGNVFSNARVSCIAGPCPFTQIRSDDFSHGGPTISVTVLNWSDSTTFLFEAEVFHSMINNSVRFSYPVIFGKTLHFTVPADAEGVCIEADLNRDPIVFPLGPEPRLSWASCTSRVNPDRTKAYKCELKSGYGFQ